MKKSEGGKVVTRRSRVEYSQDRAGRCSPTCYIASRVRPPQSARRVASLVLFLMVGLSCVSGAVPCRPVPSRAVRCRFVHTHSHVHADVHWDVQVPTGDQPSREGAAGPQMSAAHDQRAPESAPEKTDFGCNQPRFTKILPAAQGGRLSQAAGRWISTGLTSAP